MRFAEFDASFARRNRRPAATALAAAALAAACGAAPVPGAAQAADYSFHTYNNPGDLTFNQLLGIDNSGLIAGYFGSGAMNHPNQGYLFTPPSQYKSWNFPNSVQTQVTGLNDTGVTVGFWSNSDNGPPNDANFGWYAQGGKFHNVNDPNTPTTGITTNQLLGVNDSNIAVGFYNDAGGNSHGYTYNIHTKTFSSDINAPGAASTTTAAINNFGEIAGFDVLASNGVTEAFTDLNGNFRQFAVPGASSTVFLGLNDAGVAVGDYVLDGNTEGLVFNTLRDTYITLNAPLGVNPGGTTLNGINDRGEIVGFYVDMNGFTDGLLAIPSTSTASAAPSAPEPATWAMILVGFASLGLVARRRPRRVAPVA